jgi:predicted transcriptional regulator
LSIKPSATLEESLVRLASRNMTPVQTRVVQYIYTRESTSSCTYSWYVRAISKELSIPESTVKWCLNILRDMLLIEAGSASERGLPLRLTYPGLVVAEMLSKINVRMQKEVVLE